MAIPVPSEVKKFAREDIIQAVDQVSDKLGMDIKVNYLRFDAEVARDDLNEDGEPYKDARMVYVTAELHYYSEDSWHDTKYEWEYFVGDDDILFGGIDSMVEGIEDQLAEDGYIESSITASTRITAADESDDGSDYDGINDTLDDMADNIEVMQDTLDDVTEDDPDIEIDNNITNHYIAECDKCSGVFISAVTESDQEVQSVTGICPICGKESEQLLKWIVREANEGAFEDVVVDEEAL